VYRGVDDRYLHEGVPSPLTAKAADHPHRLAYNAALPLLRYNRFAAGDAGALCSVEGVCTDSCTLYKHDGSCAGGGRREEGGGYSSYTAVSRPLQLLGFYQLLIVN